MRSWQGAPDSGPLTRAASLLFCFSMIAFGLVEIVQGTHLPMLHPAGEGMLGRQLVPLIDGLLLVVCGAALASERISRLGAIGLFVPWSGWILLGQLPVVAGSAVELTSWVPLFECAIFATGALVVGLARAHRVLQVLVGAALILFGTVHLTQREFIVALIPEWLPGGPLWPYLTGIAQLLAGLALLARWRTKLAAAAICLTFITWIFVVHIARVAQSPSDPFEWTFAIAAAALATVVWLGGLSEQSRLEASERRDLGSAYPS